MSVAEAHENPDSAEPIEPAERVETAEHELHAAEPAPREIPPPPPPSEVARTPADAPFVKSPVIAAVLAVFPGLGHVYNGLYTRGITFFLLITVCISIAAESGEPIFGFMVPFVWLFSLMDSYRQANLINHGYATDLGNQGPVPKLQSGQGTLVVGIVFMLVGALELGDRFDLWRWDEVVNLWPAVFLLLGIGMVISSVRKKLEQRREEEIYD